MSVALFILELVVAAALVGRLLWWYGQRLKTEWFVYLFAFIGWFAAFSVIGSLPVDILSGRYRECLAEAALSGELCQEPIIYMDFDAMTYYWRTLYWSAFTLTWSICPFHQAFVNAGGFTYLQKAWIALRTNLILYSLMGAAGLVGLIIILSTQKLGFADLFDLIIALANIYGLVMIVGFMGYGFVELPRTLWRNSNRIRRMHYLEFYTESRYQDYVKAERELADLLATVKGLDLAIGPRDPLRPKVNIIVGKCPIDYMAVVEYNTVNPYDFDIDSLMDLHGSLLCISQARDRCRNEWERHLREAFHLMDIELCKNSPNGLFTEPWKRTDISKYARQKQQLKWYWYCRAETIVMKIISLVFVCLSLLVLWSELVLPVKTPPLSIMELILHSPNTSHVFVTETAFRAVYGTLEFIPFLGIGFNIYFPIMIAVVCLVVFFDIMPKLFSVLPFTKVFAFSEYSDGDGEDLAKGRDMLESLRAQAERAPNAELHTLKPANIADAPAAPRSQRTNKLVNELFGGTARNTSAEVTQSALTRQAMQEKYFSKGRTPGTPSPSSSSSGSSAMQSYQALEGGPEGDGLAPAPASGGGFFQRFVSGWGGSATTVPAPVGSAGADLEAATSEPVLSSLNRSDLGYGRHPSQAGPPREVNTSSYNDFFSMDASEHDAFTSAPSQSSRGRVFGTGSTTSPSTFTFDGTTNFR
ncbi:hypothetical protein H696_02129 [Fonticula alba]|uniref:Uncharacterized protein n=1 Tax=Fonticula alba TaxID=691883 RepID=A0A058ZCL4_FONAL|nr:hypothetical protein H696_02129 [Fonticula alba]KCV71177.1 hypothetical protein H696_02129 [Fonticula alba]|eukprot:XP_009494300.1 hypothetical protein H696_02129 [Fonticula alba]